jgi:hypothetical protein
LAVGLLGEEKWLGKVRGFGETLSGHEESRFENQGEVMGRQNPHFQGQKSARQVGADKVRGQGGAIYFQP